MEVFRRKLPQADTFLSSSNICDIYSSSYLLWINCSCSSLKPRLGASLITYSKNYVLDPSFFLSLSRIILISMRTNRIFPILKITFWILFFPPTTSPLLHLQNKTKNKNKQKTQPNSLKISVNFVSPI